jgi:epsilon-lactone hydrolase
VKKSKFLLCLAASTPLLALALRAATDRNRGSLAMRAAAFLIKARGKPLANVEKFRKTISNRVYPSPAAIPTSMQRLLDVHEDMIGGRKVLTLAPKAGASRWHIVYHHGGGYVGALIAPHWNVIHALIDATGATVTVPMYPLAPEFNNRDAFPFLAEVYRSVLAKTSATEIVLAGDSAGGGLALGQALELARLGLPLPARIILFAPWLDLTLSDPAAREVEARDLMLSIEALRLSGQWWAAGDDMRLPRLSPLYADLGGLPPINIYQGADDLLVADARSFARKGRAAGNDLRYREFPGAFHVFVAATAAPEAKTVFAEIGEHLSRSFTTTS